MEEKVGVLLPVDAFNYKRKCGLGGWTSLAYYFFGQSDGLA